jgi:Niemann-Pick C1 protein
MIFTANLTISLLVLLCVGLVDLFLLSLLTFWEITLNSVTIVNCVIAIGLAVDYSAHIGHAYLTIDPPEADADGKPLTNQEKRIFKARGAIGQMGPSVFHGATSTFLAIVVLSTSKSYIFTMFFRMWFGIIIFGVANGFILLPVLLSIVGPLNVVQKEVEIKHN